MIVQNQTPQIVPPSASGRFRDLILGVLILILVLVIYYPALHAGFIWDDDRYVTENPLLSAPDGLWRIWFSKHHQSQYFPMVYTTLRFEYDLWGLKPFGYHLVNVFIHAADALLLWAVLRRLEIPGAWLAAAIFAVHPVQAESVAWVTELKNTESTLFFFIALLAWIRFVRDDGLPPWKYYGLCLVMYLLALFSKTTTCTLPAALVLILSLRDKRIDLARAVQIAPFLIIGLAMGLVSIWWEGHMGNYAEQLHMSFNLPERLLISTHALWFYAGKLIWPAKLAFSYSRWHINATDPVQYGWLLGCLALIAILWAGCKFWGKLPVIAVVFFAATLSPMLGIISEYTFRFSFVADHYQYLASAGLIALLAGFAANSAVRWHLNHTVQGTLVAALLFVLSALTWQQARIYRNSETLWKDTLAKNPDSWMGEDNLGIYLVQAGRDDEAIEHFKSAIRLNPQHAKAQVNLGLELDKKCERAAAIQCYEAALKIQPDYPLAHYDLGIALANVGKFDDASDHFRKTVEQDPSFAPAWQNLVLALAKAGKKDDALETLRQESKFYPDNLAVLCDLAQGLAANGKIDEAVAVYRHALQISPGNIALLNNLGNLLFTHGQVEDGISCLKQALQIDPKNSGARFNLAMMFAQRGYLAAAKEQLTEVLRLKPDFTQAQQQLDALNASAPAVPSVK